LIAYGESDIIYIVISKYKYGGGVETVARFIHHFISMYAKRCTRKNMVKNYIIYKCHINQKQALKKNDLVNESQICINVFPIPVLEDVTYNIKYVSKIFNISKKYPNEKFVVIANAEEGLGCLLLKIIFKQRMKYIHVSHGLWRYVLSLRRKYEGFKFKIASLLVQPILDLMENMPLYFADKIIAVSNKLKQDLVATYKLPARKVSVIYNCIVDNFVEIEKSKARRILNLPQDKKVLLMVGRDIFVKGIDIGTKVFSKLDRDDVILVIVSDKKKFINRLLQEYGIDESRILLYDYVDQKKLNLLYSGADVLLFLSRYESFGLTPLEALASGTLPLISRNCGVAEVLLLNRDLYEILVTTLDEKDILNRVLYLLNLDHEEYRKIVREAKDLIFRLYRITMYKYREVLLP